LAIALGVAPSPAVARVDQGADAGVPTDDVGRWLDRSLERVVRSEQRRRRTATRRANRAHHPVVGARGYGEAGARFGGARPGRSHEGQDVFAPAGTPLVAVRAGVVVEKGSDGGRGNYLALFSPRSGETYVYLHLQAPAVVAVGQRVRGGQGVARVGCSGSCFGDHLHFEIRRGRGSGGAPVDPLPELLRWGRRR